LATLRNFIYAPIKGKGKVYPRTGHEGPEGEQRCSSTLSLTSTLDGGGCSAPRPGRFTAGKEVEWAPRPVCTGAGDFNPTGIRSPDRPPRGEFMPLYLSLILLFLATFQSLLPLIPRSFSLSFPAMSATFKSHTSNLRSVILVVFIQYKIIKCINPLKPSGFFTYHQV
jgi:hypothetical protein